MESYAGVIFFEDTLSLRYLSSYKNAKAPWHRMFLDFTADPEKINTETAAITPYQQFPQGEKMEKQIDYWFAITSLLFLFAATAGMIWFKYKSQDPDEKKEGRFLTRIFT